MVDLTHEMAKLRASLPPARSERGRVLQFVAATGGEGTSTVAREYARVAAASARRPVWLVDADLQRQGQMEALAADSDRFAGLGEESGVSPDGSAFFRVEPPLQSRDGRPLPPVRMAVARPALGGRLWVTALRTEVLGREQALTIDPAPEYWNALRKHASEIVVDAPAAERSDTAVKLAASVDLTVLVVAAETAEPEAALVLREAIEAAGGRVAGLVFNRAEATPPRLLRRFVS
jgi:Mrp family chromosome partitioning ATPase